MQLYKCDGKQISHYRKILIKAYIVYHHTSIFMFKSTLLPRSLKFESCNSYSSYDKSFFTAAFGTSSNLEITGADLDHVTLGL